MKRILAALERVTSEESQVWYHGRTVKSKDFDPKKTGKGNDQEGPGFYFSSDYDDAASYAYPNGIVITAKLDLDQLAEDEDVTREEAEILVDNSDPEDKETTFSNWSENTEVAREAVIDSIMNDDRPYLEAWYQMYKYNPEGYLDSMVELGYDGHLIRNVNNTGIQHAIMYNPKSITIEKVEDYEKEEED